MNCSPQANFERIESAWSGWPRMKRAAARAYTEDSTKGFP